MSVLVRKAVEIVDEFEGEVDALRRSEADALRRAEECADAGDYRGESMAVAEVETLREEVVDLPSVFMRKYSLMGADEREVVVMLRGYFSSPVVSERVAVLALDEGWFFELGGRSMTFVEEELAPEFEVNVLEVLRDRYEAGDYDDDREFRMEVARVIRDGRL